MGVNIVLCKFCERLFNNREDLTLDSRGSYANDNVCEQLSEGTEMCSLCKGNAKCKQTFKLFGVKFSDGDHGIGVSYLSEIGDLKTHNYSELMYINYCPVCGTRLSEGLMSDNRMLYHMSPSGEQ